MRIARRTPFAPCVPMCDHARAHDPGTQSSGAPHAKSLDASNIARGASKPPRPMSHAVWKAIGEMNIGMNARPRSVIVTSWKEKFSNSNGSSDRQPRNWYGNLRIMTPTRTQGEFQSCGSCHNPVVRRATGIGNSCSGKWRGWISPPSPGSDWKPRCLSSQSWVRTCPRFPRKSTFVRGWGWLPTTRLVVVRAPEPTSEGESPRPSMPSMCRHGATNGNVVRREKSPATRPHPTSSPRHRLRSSTQTRISNCLTEVFPYVP